MVGRGMECRINRSNSIFSTWLLSKTIIYPLFLRRRLLSKTRGSFLTRPARAASSSSKLAHQECCYSPKNWIHHENLRIASSLKNSTFKQRNQLLWRRKFFRHERDCLSHVQGPSRDFGRREVKTGPFTKLLFFYDRHEDVMGPVTSWIRPQMRPEALVNLKKVSLLSRYFHREPRSSCVVFRRDIEGNSIRRIFDVWHYKRSHTRERGREGSQTRGETYNLGTRNVCNACAEYRSQRAKINRPLAFPWNRVSVIQSL